MSKSLTTLITETRDFLDEGTADRFSDAELTRYINRGLRQVQSQIQTANEDYFLRVETVTAASGSYELALPADIWGNKLRNLWYYDNSSLASGTPYRIEPTSIENVYANLGASGLPSAYALHAGYLRWAPMLANTGTFRFVYAMKEAELTTGAQVIGQIADEHTDCIGMYAAILAKLKIAAPVKELYELYSQRMNQIINDITPMDPIRIQHQAID